MYIFRIFWKTSSNLKGFLETLFKLRQAQVSSSPSDVYFTCWWDRWRDTSANNGSTDFTSWKCLRISSATLALPEKKHKHRNYLHLQMSPLRLQDSHSLVKRKKLKNKDVLIFYVLMQFFLNGAELSLNSAISGNVINHWRMNWSKLKDPGSDMCLAGAWSLAQEVARLSPFNLLNSVKTFR